MANLQSTTVGGYTAYHSGNYNRVISRGNPGQGSPLALTSLNEVHYYYASGVSTIDISTTMVENAIYELQYVTSGSGSNIDIYLMPNHTSYSGQFYDTYWGSMPTASPSWNQWTRQQSGYFYFDHQNGSAGTTPCGTYTIFNVRDKKQVLYQGGDTNSVCYGTGRWENNTTQWSNVGTLGGLQSATDVKVYVRRIG